MKCVTFESLLDPEYPVDLLVENLLRMLNYEQQSGIAEFLSLLVDSAGCEADLTIPTDFNDRVDSVIEDLIQQCIRNPHPNSFPAQQKKFNQRLTRVITLTATAMEEAGDKEVLSQCSQSISLLLTCKLQSLRYTAAVFASSLLAAGIEDSQLQESLLLRTSDVAVGIRKLALQSCNSTEELKSALQDENAPVRLLTLRLLSSKKDVLDSDASIADRIYEMAGRDVDLLVRRAALRVLVQHKIVQESEEGEDLTNDEMVKMLSDEDDQSRKWAAELLVIKLVSENEDNDANVLLKLSDCVSSDPSNAASLAEVVSAGIRRSRLGSVAEWSRECASILTNPSKYKLKRGDQQHRSLLLILHALESFWDVQQSAELLPQLLQILDKTKHNDDLLAEALKNLTALNLSAIAALSSDNEAQVRQVGTAVVEVFSSREALPVLRAAAGALAKLPLSLRNQLKVTLYHDLRVELAELLGPRGDLPSNQKRRSKLHSVVIRLIQLSQAVDISDLIKLPLFASVSLGDQYMLNLVRAIGIRSTDPAVIDQVVSKLSTIESNKPVDDILRVCIAAKMRGIEIQPFPLDINVHTADSESVWRSAVAAEVI